MFNQANTTIEAALKAIEHITTATELEVVRVDLLGKKGKITQLLKQLGSLSYEEKTQLGSLLNNAKKVIQERLALKKELILSENLTLNLHHVSIDPTLPGVGIELGGLHPVTHTLELTTSLFEQLGFDVISGPEIENDYHNFDALNMPFHHPARAMYDTFYFNDGNLLRTHTSTIQIRAMQQSKPPHKLIAIGKVYRCDSDLTHTPMFHQIEGLLIDQEINFGNLIYILTEFLRAFFADATLKVRFRPSYFPFTEPSAEVDMECVICKGSGCKVCKNTGWLEILGCGMVHPEVLNNCKIDHKIYTGWAFGIGADRLAMLRHRINDLRLMFENDLRFLKQF